MGPERLPGDARSRYTGEHERRFLSTTWDRLAGVGHPRPAVPGGLGMVRPAPPLSLRGGGARPADPPRALQMGMDLVDRAAGSPGLWGFPLDLPGLRLPLHLPPAPDRCRAFAGISIWEAVAEAAGEHPCRLGAGGVPGGGDTHPVRGAPGCRKRRPLCDRPGCGGVRRDALHFRPASVGPGRRAPAQQPRRRGRRLRRSGSG